MAALLTTLGISIHAPREGGDLRTKVRYRLYEGFQSTPPARGATNCIKISVHICKISIHAPREGGDFPISNLFQGTGYFNPRPPRGGRLLYGCTAYFPWYFNPRPPRGGRHDKDLNDDGTPKFQSTPPARGATTSINRDCSGWLYFNPRPPRGGRRSASSSPIGVTTDFNPRPPRGGRPYDFAPGHP